MNHSKGIKIIDMSVVTPKGKNIINDGSTTNEKAKKVFNFGRCSKCMTS